ncbi:unnamed protein product [Prunus brigantina]
MKMMREKIKIKKIDNLPARQVTFSKRRRGIFKKAAELSVLCESEVAVVIFSATGKLFDYSSSSMKDVIERYQVRINGGEKFDEPSIELQPENENHIRLSKELEEKSRQLRQMKGEDLEELNFDELQKLEQLVDASLGRVIETKDERIMSEIMALERKRAELVKANKQLRQRQMLSRGNIGPALMEPERLNNNIGGGGEEEGMSSESATSTTCNSAPSLSLEDDSDDVTLSLKLGQPAGEAAISLSHSLSFSENTRTSDPGTPQKGGMVKTMRKKIKIKKIDYLPARQVTFSKRRRGIFKKAEELSVLCESEVAVVIFSATGKLFDYSSSSTKDVVERYKAHTNGVEKSDEPSVELQLEIENHIRLTKELEEKSRQLRQMRGEDLEELNIDELQKLEQLVDASFGRVIETKEELIMSEIMALEKKGAELVEANNQLRQRMVTLSRGNIGPALTEPERLINNIGGGGEEGMSSESATNATISSCSSGLSLSLEDDCSDVTLALKLGLGPASIEDVLWVCRASLFRIIIINLPPFLYLKYRKLQLRDPNTILLKTYGRKYLKKYIYWIQVFFLGVSTVQNGSVSPQNNGRINYKITIWFGSILTKVMKKI